LDHQVKIRGNRIETGEVEAVLREQPGVRDAVVMARESSRGENDMVAYVVGSNDSALLPGAVREMLGYRLPAYMIPSSIVVLDSLPLTANGKVDRKSLAARKLPEPASPATFVPPRTELESTIAAVWREVLELDEVGVTDNFFDIGGQSVLMLQVYGKLQKQLKKDLVITDFFRLPTISSLTEHLNTREAQTPSFEEKYESAETKREGMRRRKRRMKDR
ncbi:MAG TPA: phosphopantetheine-binding protein, partial [Blastocatellia bacterium]|nr:phosphopantetheine-binding protein [Blastocatellia bacterium]